MSSPSQHDWYIYMRLYMTLWQPGITAPPLHSSQICLIGFHYKASQLHGPRRPERTVKWKNKARIRKAVSFWVIWLPPQEWVGWISHMAIWRISTHSVYCIQWLTPGNMGQFCEEVERSLRRQREGIKPGNSESGEQLSAKWESITCYRHNSKLSHEKYIYKYSRKLKYQKKNWGYLAMSVYNVGYICLHLISLLSSSLWDFISIKWRKIDFCLSLLTKTWKVISKSLLSFSRFTLLWWVHKKILSTELTGTMQSAESSSSAVHNEVCSLSSNTEALFIQRNVPSDFVFLFFLTF